MGAEHLIRTASDAKALRHAARPLTPSPTSFDETLSDLAERFILPNLPGASAVADFHRALLTYVEQPDAIFLLRAMSGTERRQFYTTEDGTRFKATDNAPAWWVHGTLLQGWMIADGAFGEVMATMPAHFHDVARTCPPTASEAGWHIAHIFDVKDRQTNYERFTRQEVIRRFVRSVHPCNYFLLPKPSWQRWGSDERVIGFFASLYAERYKDVWNDFLTLAGCSTRSLAHSVTPIAYKYDSSTTTHSSGSIPSQPSRAIRTPSQTEEGEEGLAEYRASRLTFKRDVIEPLPAHGIFRVITPIGTFEMTKADLPDLSRCSQK